MAVLSLLPLLVIVLCVVLNKTKIEECLRDWHWHHCVSTGSSYEWNVTEWTERWLVEGLRRAGLLVNHTNVGISV